MTKLHKSDAQAYRKALESLGWTQVKAANKLGVNPRTSRRYALGESRVPPWTKAALRAAGAKVPQWRKKRELWTT